MEWGGRMDLRWVLGWHAAMLVACIPAALLWKGSKARKAAVFIICFALTVCVAWLPIENVPTFELAFAIPLLAILAALCLRGGLWRWAAGIPAAAIVAGLLYSVTAMRVSNAMFPLDGIANLPMFLTAKSAIRENLNDPDSATFRNLRANKYHGKWYVCGEVNARNRMGGFVGFTDFYVPVNDVLPFPAMVDSDDPSSRLTYMQTCYGDDWDKIEP
jgi:hypothetical protein